MVGQIVLKVSCFSKPTTQNPNISFSIDTLFNSIRMLSVIFKRKNVTDMDIKVCLMAGHSSDCILNLLNNEVDLSITRIEYSVNLPNFLL